MNLTEATPFYKTTSWLTATTVSVFCWIVLFWILLSLLCYGVKSNKWKKASLVSSANDKDGSVLFTIAVIGSAFSLTHTSVNLLVYNFGYDGSTLHVCTVGVIVSVEFFAFTMSWSYLFLWLKQYAIYQHNFFNHLYTVWIRAISWCSLVMMLVGLNTAIIIYNSLSNFVHSSVGCLNKGAHWPAIYGTVVNGSGQLIMLLLFFYPVTKLPESRSSCRVVRILKRTTICTTFCVLSDLVAGIYVGVSDSSDKVGLSFYNFNLVLNMVAVVMTFETWADILLSPCRFTYDEDPSTP